jgi:hypothetical protein
MTSKLTLIIGAALIAVTAASATLAVTLLTTRNGNATAPARVVYVTTRPSPTPVASAARHDSPSPSHQAQTAPSRSAAPAPLPYVTLGSYTGREPDTIDFSADAGNVVSDIQWSEWNASGATGYGESAVESCDPNCATGNVTEVPVTVTLSDPSGGIFAVMTETKQGNTSAWYYPSQWAGGAS